jgi:hypothetical protein
MTEETVFTIFGRRTSRHKEASRIKGTVTADREDTHVTESGKPLKIRLRTRSG